MNLKVRGTSKNSSIRTNKPRKKLIKERNEKIQITRLRRKIIKELKELVHRQTEKHKSYNTRRRVNRLGLKKIGKRENLTNRDIKKVKQLNELTTHGLKTIAKLREIKNYNNLTREDLIYTLLRSEGAPQENNYLRYLDNALNSELKKRINNARVLTAKLGNILTNKEKKTIGDELYRLENTKYTKTERERAIAYLIKLTRDLRNKQKYHHSTCHDQNYYGIKDIKHLFNETIDDYYKPILVRFAFDNNFEEYEIRGDKHKNLMLKEYLVTITPQLTNLIEEKKNSTQDEQKVQLTMAIIFKHITNPIKKYTIYVKSKNIEIRTKDDTDDIITKLLDSFLENYEREENILRNGSCYIFDCIDLTLVEFHSIQLKRGSSYIPSPKWIEKKKATINPQNTKDDYCFVYSIAAALHHEEIDKNPHRIKKLIPYISNYNWEDIKFPTGQKAWKTFERNNNDIALNVFSAHTTDKKLNLMRKLDYNHKRQHIVDLLMITANQNNWHYLTIKNMKRLFRGVTSNHHGDFFRRNCMHSYRTENALKKHERLCTNHDYCEIVMPKPSKNILEFKSNDKSLHMPRIIYADLEVILKKIQSCQPNPENSYTEKKNVHMACSYALNVIRTYDENLITSYRGTDCMKKFASALKTMAKMIINTPQKPMTSLTDEENRNHERSNRCHICNEKFIHNKENEKYREYCKVRDHCHCTGKYRGAAHSKCNLQYKVPKEITVVFHNRSKYDYHLIINELAKGIASITCLGDDTEKYITFKIPLKKENEDRKFITYKLKFIDSFRFMNRSLSDLVDNLSEINKQQCLKCKEIKNQSIDCKLIVYANNRLIYKCVECKNKSYKPIAPLIERFPSTYQFCGGDNNEFVLLLRKGVYPYDCTDDWDRFKETQLPLMEDFHNT